MNDKRFFEAVMVTGVLMLLAVPTASADDDTGWYAGVGVNRLDADFKDRSDLSFDDSDNTASVKLGYMFNPWFGLEGGYLDLGDYTGGGGLNVDADAFQFAGILNWEAGEIVDLYAKLGAFFLNANSDQFIPGVGQVKEDDDATEA
ncbi:MAG: outer membrane beta-barrel protein, partial [Gammaproteobacteria bacterium]|nr:outer membrane beta-barrel protein [Gammaproteobacteria bacterium]